MSVLLDQTQWVRILWEGAYSIYIRQRLRSEQAIRCSEDMVW
jgi:hypothetical protein